MKKQTILAISAVVVLLAASVSVIAWEQTAEAAKAAGVKNNQYGQNTKGIVCGDRLCSEITSEDGTLQVRGGAMAEQKQIQQNYNINSIMNRMDVMHEQHQRQMIEMWNLMSHEDQVKMAKKMNHMMDMMSSMNMKDFISLMGNMDWKSHEGMMMNAEKRYGDMKMHGDYAKKMHGDYGEKKQGNYHADKKHKTMQGMMLDGISDPEIRQQVTDEMHRHYQKMLELADAGIDDPELKAKLLEKIQKYIDKTKS